MTKSHLLYFALVLTLLALAAPAKAAPPQCEDSCKCTSSCVQPCSIGASITKCGPWGVCIGHCLAAGASAEREDVLLNAIFAAPQEAQASVCPE